MAKYSRRQKIKTKRITRKALAYIFVAIFLVAAVTYYGIPLIANVSGLLRDVRESSEPVDTGDSIPPFQPRFDPIDNFTNKDEVVLSGKAEAGSEVEVFVNNEKYETLADSGGKFSLTVMIEQEENDIYAVSYDSAGNKSNRSIKITITKDKEPPELIIIKPEDNEDFSGSKQRQIEIQGTTEDSAAVMINDRRVVVENDGSFSLITSLSEGENTFSVIARDKTGNETSQEFTVYFTP